jgi:hypothetical protein
MKGEEGSWGVSFVDCLVPQIIRVGLLIALAVCRHLPVSTGFGGKTRCSLRSMPSLMAIKCCIKANRYWERPSVPASSTGGFVAMVPTAACLAFHWQWSPSAGFGFYVGSKDLFKDPSTPSPHRSASALVKPNQQSDVPEHTTKNIPLRQNRSTPPYPSHTHRHHPGQPHDPRP